MPAGCGGEIQVPQDATEGILESPNYGHAYFPNLDCTWILSIGADRNSSQPSDSPASGQAIGTTTEVAAGPPDDSETAALKAYLADLKLSLVFVDFDVPTTVTQYAVKMLKGVVISSCSGDNLLVRIHSHW